MKLMFRTRDGAEIEPEILNVIEEKLTIVETASGNRLPVYHLKHPDSVFTVIFSHGNSSDMGHMVYKAMDLVLHCGVSVVLYEYSGYGQASGKATEASTYSDIRAVFNYVTEKLEVPWNHIILYGQSLGSGPSIDLASQQPVGAVILHSPLASVLLILASDITSSPKFDIFRNICKIPRVQCPVFYMHGTEDKVVPIRNSEWLYDQTPFKYPPWWIDGGDHNRLELNYRVEFYSKLREFVKYVENLQASMSNENLTTRFTPRISTLEVSPSQRVSADIKTEGVRAVSPEC
eukprot:CAMPEP_0204914756 /NCGR_PEP_ID=MMETSP1397-20131031/12645_1 /ASSEMBLY_ACC=CAM_ASM_000891 /TAXON_ID=49980 /ORGANISM="Climacostomum Climacostomum virens, Strain Stock W-24" /LENGTH=289 /DNA_ID=CAMNT_0052086465 /DNA_START=95 /DNA_END=964 /DNA_ORIENTATION=+